MRGCSFGQKPLQQPLQHRSEVMRLPSSGAEPACSTGGCLYLKHLLQWKAPYPLTPHLW